MEKELQETFQFYLHEFKTDESVNVKIKNLILDNIQYDKEIFEILHTFLCIAQEKNYAYSIALAHAMYFWMYYSYDLETAVTYNEKARTLFEALPGYEHQEGILTVMNNAVIAHIMSGNYERAYMEISQAMIWAKKQKQMSYYSAFLNNGSYILFEFGLYKKARKQILEMLEMREQIGEIRYFKTIYLLSILYLHMKDAHHLRSLYKEHEQELREEKYFKFALFQKMLLEAAILEDQEEEADALFQALTQNYEMLEENTSDNLDMYLSYAHYYMYKKQYDKAEACYQILETEKQSMLGSRQLLLHEQAKLCECKKEYEKASALLREAYDNSLRYDQYVDSLLIQEMEDIWGNYRMFSYETLYEQLLHMSEIGRQLTSALTWDQLFTTIRTKLDELLFHSMEILVFDHTTNHYLIHSSNIQQPVRTLILEDNPALQRCIQKKETLSISNTLVQSKWEKELPAFYDEQILSLLCKPIIHQDTLIGILCLRSENAANFDDGLQGLLDVFCDYLSISILNIERYHMAVQESSYDYLTKTLNRSGLMNLGDEMLEYCRSHNESIAILMIDIDDFKMVNDTYGHMFGDDVIRMVTKIMDDLKEDGITARFGGEEFTMLIHGKSKDEVYQKAEMIRHTCETSRLYYQTKEVHVTISIGCFYSQDAQVSLQEMMDKADQQLYIAKRNGKNYVQM